MVETVGETGTPSIHGPWHPSTNTRLMFSRASLPACSCRGALVRATQNSAAARRVLRLGALHSSAGASASQPSSVPPAVGSSSAPPRSPRPSGSGRARSEAVAAAIAAVGAGVWWWSSAEEERLSEQRFVPLKITSVKRITADTSIYKLALPKSMLSASGPSGPILSLYLMQPDLQIQRPYTVSLYFARSRVPSRSPVASAAELRTLRTRRPRRR